jgi:Ser/Thr protein kinase RdoA (MazF antagonist)
MTIDHLLLESQSPAPNFSRETAAGIARDLFGLEGKTRLLAGERDRNYRIDLPDGSRRLLKIWNQAQDPAVIDFQLSLLEHLRVQAPSLPVPRVLHSPSGERWAVVPGEGGRDYVACLLSWLDGDALRNAPATPRLFHSLGSALGRLDQALANFHHAASHRDMLWDVSRVQRLRVLLGSVDDVSTAQSARSMLDRFESSVLPGLASLPHQALHADFNLDNVLVRACPEPGSEPDVCGIVDFGDALFAPRICELAIAGAYHLLPGSEPLANVQRIVAAYNDVLGLGEEELLHLPGLIGARLVSSILITSHMAALHPQNRDYLLIDNRAAAVRLDQLLQHDMEALAESFIHACT